MMDISIVQKHGADWYRLTCSDCGRHVGDAWPAVWSLERLQAWSCIYCLGRSVRLGPSADPENDRDDEFERSHPEDAFGSHLGEEIRSHVGQWPFGAS